jgi:hypothetical protein
MAARLLCDVVPRVTFVLRHATEEVIYITRIDEH